MSSDNHFTNVQNKAVFIPSITTENINASQFNLISNSSQLRISSGIGPTGPTGFTGPTGSTGPTGTIGVIGLSKGFNVVFGANITGPNQYLIYNGSAISEMSLASTVYKTRFYLPVTANLRSFSFATQSATSSTRLDIKKNGSTIMSIKDLEDNFGYQDTNLIFNKGQYCEIIQSSGTSTRETVITLYFS
jgi:hypothetical protein